ncbi:MAG: DPP IV N-terminal domain-containing protein [Gemmataceae bacterium]
MLKRLLLSLGLCGFLGALLAAPAAVQPKILFPIKRSNTSFEINLMDADGTDANKLTDSKVFNTFPAWSPNGKPISFCRYEEGQPSAIWIMDADGKNAKPLTKGPDRAPAWSPDGKTIAFSHNGEIHVMDADGGNQINLTRNETFDVDASWSPDGKQIAFSSSRSGEGFKIYVMDADGENVTEISKTGNILGFSFPAWSPDGKKIAYAEQDGTNLEIFLCDPDGENAKQLTKLGGKCTYAAWSPDGKQLLFRRLENDVAGALYLMDADGGNQKAILKIEDTIDGCRPAWQPK